MSNKPGKHSDSTANQPFDPPNTLEEHRLFAVYALPLEVKDFCEGLLAPDDFFYFGRLKKFLEMAENELPGIIKSEVWQAKEIELKRSQEKVQISKVQTVVYTLSTGQVVGVLTLSFKSGNLMDIIPLLTDGYYGDICIGGQSLLDVFISLIPEKILKTASQSQVFESECHQILSLGKETPELDFETTQRLVYWADLPCVKSFSSIIYPEELNRRPYASCALSPYVTVMKSQQEYIINCAVLSAIKIVAAATRLRKIRTFTYEALKALRKTLRERADVNTRRRQLAQLSEELSRLELDISFGVEAHSDIGLLIPSLRVDNYHKHLSQSLDLSNRLNAISLMLQRIDKAISAELNSIMTVERQKDERRRRMWAIMIGFITVISIPLTLLFAFLGINAMEVDASASMFDLVRYGWVYLSIAIIVCVGFLLMLLTWFFGVFQGKSLNEFSKVP